MNCYICGLEEGQCPFNPVEPRPHLRYRVACKQHAEETPKKVGRREFDLAYWGEGLEEVDHRTRRGFYDDYLSSTHTLEEYIKRTSEPVLL